MKTKKLENAPSEAQNDLALARAGENENNTQDAGGALPAAPCSALDSSSEKHKLEMEEAHQRMVERMRLKGIFKRIKMSLLCLFGKRTVAYCLSRDTADVMKSLRRACQDRQRAEKGKV